MKLYKKILKKSYRPVSLLACRSDLAWAVFCFLEPIIYKPLIVRVSGDQIKFG